MSKKLEEKCLVRKAGMSEQAIIARTSNGFYNNFAFVGIYNRKLTPSLIYQVLKKMILKYSFLTANYDKDTNKIFPMSKIYFNDAVELRKVEILDYEKLFEEIESYKFPLNIDKPIFKISCINDTVLAVIFDHAVFDGVSGTNFHLIFLEILNSLDEDELNLDCGLHSDSLLFDLTKSLDELDSFPLATEDYLNYVPDVPLSYKKAIKRCLPQSFGKFINDHQYSEPPLVPGKICSKWQAGKQKQDFKTAFKNINIPPETVKSAIKLCRSKNVTLTPLLEVIVCQTLCILGILKDSTQESECYFIKSVTPSDLRRFLDPRMGNKLKLGLRVNPMIFHYHLIEEIMKSYEDKEVFWNIVERSYNTISKSSSDPKSIVNQWYALNTSYDENSLSKMSISNMKGFEKGSGPTVRLSNLGLFQNDETKTTKFALENAYFSQSLGVNGGIIMVNIVSTKKGGMNIVCSCMEEEFGGKAGLNNFAVAFEKSFMRYVNEPM